MINFPLLDSVTLSATRTITQVMAKWQSGDTRGLHREETTFSPVPISCPLTSGPIHLKKSSGVKINKTLLTVVFGSTCLFVAINHG